MNILPQTCLLTKTITFISHLKWQRKKKNIECSQMQVEKFWIEHIKRQRGYFTFNAKGISSSTVLA